MKKTHTKIIILCLLLLYNSISAQSYISYKLKQEVLKKALVDSTFIFGKWSKGGDEEMHLTYLGKFTTTNGKTFKVVNSIWIWGLSKRATSRILIFNNHNQYVGNYYLTTTSNLPTKLETGKLIFKNNDSYCDNTLVTIINLRKGLPKQFFRKCKEDIGDVIFFSSE